MFHTSSLFALTPIYDSLMLIMSGSKNDSRPILIKRCSGFSRAFDHGSLDQPQAPIIKAVGDILYLPISLGTVVLILVVVWLVRG